MLRVLFEVGPVKLYSYGAMLVVALLAGLLVARKRAATYGLPREKMYDALFWAMIPGILGARIVFIAQEWKYFSTHQSELFSLQFSGLTSFGGVVFGFIGLWVWAKKSGFNFVNVLDALGAAFLVAHPVGRIGCLLNGCCYGRVCDTWYGVHTHPGSLLFEPAQLYDGAFNLLGLGILLLLERRGLKPGQSFGWAFVFHGVARFFYEFYRAGTVAEVERGLASSTLIPGAPITEGHVAAIAVALAGLIVVIVKSRAPSPLVGKAAGGAEDQSSS